MTTGLKGTDDHRLAAHTVLSEEARAGLHATRLDGSPLAYNRADPWLPDLLVCRPEVAEPILTALSTSPQEV